MEKYYLSLDPSMLSTGWTIISVNDGGVLLVDGGYIDTHGLGNPLRVIRSELGQIARLYPIERVIPKEQMFYRHNMASMALAKVHGIIEELLADYTVHDIPSATIRKVIGGHGKADKERIANGVRRLLQLPPQFVFPRFDISDAASVGLTYLHQMNLLPLIA